ncbi:hypothetical protein VB715_07105 [Crocosphaera sp. UHCC 0190]|uniref:hypothetical protein n=1 Tax=Crocosphaera sp. UHCC 0190 TaxID=3110246 RepID=UPI002B1F2B13|nr:hypothetical protein [Crocosphaera sp. UHCC 0190]MEA5509528.1 hypothetical protein [Crocosphaera sp. UHCC 0190]
MPRKINLQSLTIRLCFSLILIGCTPENNVLGENSYQPINLTEVEGELTGDNPEAMTLELFGIKEKVEGNFSQEITANKQEGFDKIVMLTQMNLPDDSVRGIRYRLQFQFDQSIGKWRLIEVGRQQSCYRSKESSDWTIEPCP